MRTGSRLVAFVAMVAFAALPCTATDEVRFAGSYVWERNDLTSAGELDVFFTPGEEGEWRVAFHFDWEDEPHVFEGTASGSLSGELKGAVASDDPGHPLKFEFKGEFAEGTFAGTHGYFNGKGELAYSGTLELAPAAGYVSVPGHGPIGYGN